MNDSLYRSRKFGLAVFFALTTVVGLFTGYVNEGTFVANTGLILGLYGAANVAAKSKETE